MAPLYQHIEKPNEAEHAVRTTQRKQILSWTAILARSRFFGIDYVLFWTGSVDVTQGPPRGLQRCTVELCHSMASPV